MHVRVITKQIHDLFFFRLMWPLAAFKEQEAVTIIYKIGKTEI